MHVGLKIMLLEPTQARPETTGEYVQVIIVGVPVWCNKHLLSG